MTAIQWQTNKLHEIHQWVVSNDIRSVIRTLVRYLMASLRPDINYDQTPPFEMRQPFLTPISLFLILLIASSSRLREPSLPSESPTFPHICDNIQLLQLDSNFSTFSIQVRLDQIDFPETVRSTFLSVLTRTGNIILNHQIGGFSEFINGSEIVHFSIVHPIAGPTDFHLLCANEEIVHRQFHISLLNGYELGYTRLYASQHVTARMIDFCWREMGLEIFLKEETHGVPMRAAYDFRIPYRFHQTTARDFREKWKPKIFRESVLFIAATPKELWRELVDVLLPMWRVLLDQKNREKKRIFLVRKTFGVTNNIEKVGVGQLIENADIACFSDGQFVSSTGAVSIGRSIPETYKESEAVALARQLTELSQIRSENMTGFIEKFTNGIMREDRIVIDGKITGLAGQLRQWYPFLMIEELPITDDLSVVADSVRGARIFVCSHISTCVFGIFLGRNGTMLEIPPDGFECTTFGEIYAQLAKAEYFPLLTSERCSSICSKLSCYLDMEPSYQRSHIEMIRMAVGKILKLQ
jgi:hypothetical protein